MATRTGVPASIAAGAPRLFAFRYAIIAPAVFLILLVGVYPLVQLLVTSLQNITMFEDDRTLAGLAHYARLWHDGRFLGALARTIGFMLVALPLQVLLGFALALLFLERLPGRQLMIALILLPTVISPIVAGATWRLLFDHRFGPINQIVAWAAGTEIELLWTVSPALVWPAILIADTWQWTPFMFLLLLTALSGVDQEQLEAASIDGASWWRVFRCIVLPAILPVLAVAALMRALDLMRLFDLVWTMTQGGPGTRTETLSIYAYQLAFREFETSYTAAMALVVIVLLTLAVIALLRLIEQRL